MSVDHKQIIDQDAQLIASFLYDYMEHPGIRGWMEQAATQELGDGAFASKLIGESLTLLIGVPGHSGRILRADFARDASHYLALHAPSLGILVTYARMVRIIPDKVRPSETVLDAALSLFHESMKDIAHLASTSSE